MLKKLRFLAPVVMTAFTVLVSPTLPLAVQQGAATPVQTEHFTLQATVVADTVKLGSPILIDLVLTNVSDHTIQVYWAGLPGGEGLVYRAHVWDSKGTEPSQTRFMRILTGHLNAQDRVRGGHIGFISAAWMPMGPGEKRTNRIDLNKLYEMTEPGKYMIQVWRDGGPESTWGVEANKVTVTLTK